MRTEIDISEPEGSYGTRLPHPTVLTDDGDIVLSFGDVALRMTYAQFDELYCAMRKRWESVPTGDGPATLSVDPDELEEVR